MCSILTLQNEEEEEEAGEGDEDEADHEEEDTGDGAAQERAPERADSEDEDEEKAAPAPVPAKTMEMDILGALSDLQVTNTTTSTTSVAPQPMAVTKNIVLAAEKGNDLQVSTSFSRRNGQIFMDMLLENKSQTPLRQFAIKFNKNFFGITAGGPIQVKTSTIAPGESSEATLPLATNGEVEVKSKPRVLQVAIKSDLGVSYFQDQIDIHHLFSEDGQLGQQDFLSKWKTLTDEHEVEMELKDVPQLETDAIQQR